jgi:ABC-2 type transport system permease protein
VSAVHPVWPVRLRALLGKEFLQLLRDPRMRFFVFLPPLLQLVIFGYAATYDVRLANIAVVDSVMTSATRGIVADVTASGHFRVHAYNDMAKAAEALNRSEVRAIIRFDPDYVRSPAIQIVTDGSDSNSAQLIFGQLAQTIRDSVFRSSGLSPPVQIEERAWFNPNLNDREYFIPGIIANLMLITTMILTAMTVVRERELGTLEQVMVSPLSNLEFIIGKMIPVATIGLIDVFLISLIAILWFDVPFRGSPLALLFSSMLFLMSSLGLGLLISSYSGTQQQAMILAFFFVMPFVILSGFAFPIRNMPHWVQLFTWIDPLRFYIVVVRDLFLKGGGVFDHLFEYGMMALLGVVSMGLSLLRIR